MWGEMKSDISDVGIFPLSSLSWCIFPLAQFHIWRSINDVNKSIKLKLSNFMISN